MTTPKYRQLLRAVSETPWALLPSKLAVILEIVSLRLEGHKFSEEEIQERIGAARQRPKPAPVGASGGVAVIPIAGVIAPKANMFSAISGGCSLEEFSSSLAEALGNDAISTILLDVDSPGGSVDLVPETAAAIRAARGRKQIVAIANTTAASAAYWLGSQADEFVVTPSGEVGSIGVFCAHDDISGAQEKMGVKTTLVSAGKYKVEGNPFEPLSEEARQAIQDSVDQFYGMFVADVAKGRGVDQQAVIDGFGQGRMLTAKDALKAGMVDRVESFDQTLSRLAGGAVAPASRRRAEEVLDLAALAALTSTGDGIAASAGGLASALDALKRPAGELLPEPPDPETTAVDPERPQQDVNDPAGAPAPAPSAPPEQSSRATASSTPLRKDGTMFTSIEELVARQDEIRTRQQEIDAEHPGAALPEDLRTEFDSLDTEWNELAEAITDISDRKAKLGAKAKAEKNVERGDGPSVPMTNVGRKTPDNIYALEEYRSRAGSMEEQVALYADGAKRAIELATFPHPQANREDVQAHIERLLAGDTEDGAIARRLLATGSQGYERAFGKMVLGKPLSGSEMQALSMSALSIGTPSDGGFAIPFTLDPSVIPTSNGAVNPWRQISRVVTITGNQWKGVTSDGVSVAYEAEATEVAEGSPALVQPELDVEKAQAYIKFSIEVEGDWSAMRAELAQMLSDAKDVKEAQKFALGAGHGSHEPQGIVANLAGGDIVDTATVNTFALTDIDKLDNELPPRYEPRGQIVANKAFYNAVRALAGETFDVWMPLAQGIAKGPNGMTGRTLAGYPTWRCSEMSSGMGTGGEKVALLGDFNYFAIVDRLGMSAEVLPLVVGANGRPTGERGLYCYFRNTSGILSSKAFRLLRIKHS